jgi:hypothetical protein
MKKDLHRISFVFLFLVSAIVPDEIQAQCTCSDGLPATPQVHYVVLDTTNAPTSTISFPQFNPSIGILSCLDFRDTTSLVVTSIMRNTAPTPVEYAWLLSVTNNITGPGITINQSANRTYGPDLLAEGGNTPADTIAYGPDTLFENKFNQRNSASIASYLGTGTVNFVYKVFGGAVPTMGSTDYLYSIKSRYWGAFRLTYYWCPNLVLSTNIKNFFAVKNNKKVDISWITENEQSTNTYEIQISQNGKDFRPVGSKKAQSAPQGTAAKYTYQYNPDQTSAGKLYIRIKQTDANGKISYTTVQTLNIDSDTPGGFTLYPNPVVNRVSLQFDGNLNGSYRIDITNQIGQTVYAEIAKFRNQSKTDLKIAGSIAPGIYYIRVKDEANTQVYSNKIMIQR